MCSISLAVVEAIAILPVTAVRDNRYSKGKLIAITTEIGLVPALKRLCLRHKGAGF